MRLMNFASLDSNVAASKKKTNVPLILRKKSNCVPDWTIDDQAWIENNNTKEETFSTVHAPARCHGTGPDTEVFDPFFLHQNDLSLRSANASSQPKGRRKNRVAGNGLTTVNFPFSSRSTLHRVDAQCKDGFGNIEGWSLFDPNFVESNFVDNHFRTLSFDQPTDGIPSSSSYLSGRAMNVDNSLESRNVEPNHFGFYTAASHESNNGKWNFPHLSSCKTSLPTRPLPIQYSKAKLYRKFSFKSNLTRQFQPKVSTLTKSTSKCELWNVAKSKIVSRALSRHQNFSNVDAKKKVPELPRCGHTTPGDNLNIKGKRPSGIRYCNEKRAAVSSASLRPTSLSVCLTATDVSSQTSSGSSKSSPNEFPPDVLTFVESIDVNNQFSSEKYGFALNKGWSKLDLLVLKPESGANAIETAQADETNGLQVFCVQTSIENVDATLQEENIETSNTLTSWATQDWLAPTVACTDDKKDDPKNDHFSMFDKNGQNMTFINETKVIAERLVTDSAQTEATLKACGKPNSQTARKFYSQGRVCTVSERDVNTKNCETDRAQVKTLQKTFTDPEAEKGLKPFSDLKDAASIKGSIDEESIRSLNPSLSTVTERQIEVHTKENVHLTYHTVPCTKTCENLFENLAGYEFLDGSDEETLNVGNNSDFEESKIQAAHNQVLLQEKDASLFQDPFVVFDQEPNYTCHNNCSSVARELAFVSTDDKNVTETSIVHFSPYLQECRSNTPPIFKDSKSCIASEKTVCICNSHPVKSMHQCESVEKSKERNKQEVAAGKYSQFHESKECASTPLNSNQCGENVSMHDAAELVAKRYSINAPKNTGFLTSQNNCVNYSKYLKMLDVGLPIGAVRNAIERDGAYSAVLDKNTICTELSSPSRIKALEKLFDTKATQVQSTKVKDQYRRTRVYWGTPVTVHSNSLWAMILQDPEVNEVAVDETEFATLFQVKETYSVAPPSQGMGSKTGAVKVIDPKRANNGGITLARLKMSYSEMAKAIEDMNVNVLTSEQIQGIMEYIPSDDEANDLRKYLLEHNGLDALCECEKFMVSVMSVTNAKAKMQAILFKLQFPILVDGLQDNLFTVEQACDEIMTSDRFRKVLAVILKIGNRLNSAGRECPCDVQAFTIDSLMKLHQVKAFDRKTTFLDYIVMLISKGNDSILCLKEDFPNVSKASTIRWDHCETGLVSLEDKLKIIQKVTTSNALCNPIAIHALGANNIDCFTLHEATGAILALRQRMRLVNLKFVQLLIFLGEDEQKKYQPHELFHIISFFCKQLDAARNKLEANSCVKGCVHPWKIKM